jgi:hypothetical protein
LQLTGNSFEVRERKREEGLTAEALGSEPREETATEADFTTEGAERTRSAEVGAEKRGLTLS